MNLRKHHIIYLLVHRYLRSISCSILKSIEMEKEGSSSPKKVAGQNSVSRNIDSIEDFWNLLLFEIANIKLKGRFRSALKEKAYKSHIVHSRHRRHFIDPSVPSPSTSAESETDALSASQVIKKSLL